MDYLGRPVQHPAFCGLLYVRFVVYLPYFPLVLTIIQSINQLTLLFILLYPLKVIGPSGQFSHPSLLGEPALLYFPLLVFGYHHLSSDNNIIALIST